LRLNLNTCWSAALVAFSTLPLVPLDAMQVGEIGFVAEVDGPAVAVNRLQELGLRVGQRVRMVQPGPPHIVQFGETRLCLRPEPDVLVLIGFGDD
jgi:Fe2+ transport system protein FeoA